MSDNEFFPSVVRPPYDPPPPAWARQQPDVQSADEVVQEPTTERDETAPTAGQSTVQ